MGTALLCDVGFETVVVNESVRVRSNDGRSIGWGRCCFSQIRLVRNGREETRSDWHVVSPTDTTTSRQTTSSLIGPGQSCSVEPRSDILASLARWSRRPRCDLGGGNHAVHRSTACGVIRMEHQLAVPGDGQRYPIEVSTNLSAEHEALCPNLDSLPIGRRHLRCHRTRLVYALFQHSKISFCGDS